MPTKIFLIICAVTMCACSAMPDQNIDPAKNNAASFRKDWKECREDYPELGSGAHVPQWLSCMSLKGWR